MQYIARAIDYDLCSSSDYRVAMSDSDPLLKAVSLNSKASSTEDGSKVRYDHELFIMQRDVIS